MRRREGVVDIDVAQRRELVDEGRVVLLLLLVEAEVLQQQHVARLQRAAPPSSASGPMQSSAKATGLPSALASGSTRGLSDISGTRLPSGRPKWLSTITLAPLAASSRERRRGALDARGVGHLAVLHRHVEVDAHQHALAGHVDGIDRLEVAGHALLGHFADDKYQHVALARRRDQFMAGLPAIGGEILFGRRIGGAHGQQAADRQLAQLAVGAQHRQRAEQARRVVFECRSVIARR